MHAGQTFTKFYTEVKSYLRFSGPLVKYCLLRSPSKFDTAFKKG